MTNARTPKDATPVAPAGTGRVGIGSAVSRVDGRAKVTGQAHYAADHAVDRLAYGVVLTSTVARGRLTDLQTDAALAVPGVLTVYSHLNRPGAGTKPSLYKDEVSPEGKPFRPFIDDTVHFSGQPVALVVAESFEAARHAASLVEAQYASIDHRTDLLLHREQGETVKAPPGPIGDADAALASAAVRVHSELHNTPEHHNPMELLAATAIPEADGTLTIYDKTQGPQNSHGYVTKVFGLKKDAVTVRNPYVGGGFGVALRPQVPLMLATLAALDLQCPVRVVLTREQMFGTGHRPDTWQRVQLGAAPDGRLQAIVHEVAHATSRYEQHTETVAGWSGKLYACDNIRLEQKAVALDQVTPTYMRAPGATNGLVALEIAMDELAHALRMDPLALRLKNHSARSPVDDLPYSTKALKACYAQGAERFGWSRRPIAPRSMFAGHERVGWGMATGQWEALQQEAQASATLHSDGRLDVCSATSDIGTGTATALGQIAAGVLGLALEHVSVAIGDSTLPKAPLEGGSATISSVGSAVEGACLKLRHQLWQLARKLPGRAFLQATPEQLAFEDGVLRVRGDNAASVGLGELLAASGKSSIEANFTLKPDAAEQKRHARGTHAAVFAEVRVDEALGTVRVTRIVSAIDAGRIVNPKTATSQIIGGVVWGIGQALHEETLTDHALGRVMNHSLAEYHIPTHADIGDIDVIFIEEDDRVVSSLGGKGVGEIGIVGVAAAIHNAVFHATGRRVRTLPMTPDRVLQAPVDGTTLPGVTPRTTAPRLRLHGHTVAGEPVA